MSTIITLWPIRIYKQFLVIITNFSIYFSLSCPYVTTLPIFSVPFVKYAFTEEKNALYLWVLPWLFFLFCPSSLPFSFLPLFLPSSFFPLFLPSSLPFFCVSYFCNDTKAQFGPFIKNQTWFMAMKASTFNVWRTVALRAWSSHGSRRKKQEEIKIAF